MSSYLVLILCLTAIQCQDICQLIQTSGHFTGLQVYHSQPSDKLFMYKNGIQWQFDIKWIVKNYTLQVISNTNQTIDLKIINMFGGYDRTSDYYYDCNVKHQSPEKSKIVTDCTNSTPIDNDSQYNPKSVIFKATESDDNWVLIYDKNEPKISCYDTRKVPNERLKAQAVCQRDIPKFIMDMTPDLLKSIDGVVDYKVGPVFGHILFFNINGRPKYCYQRIDEDLECNSNEVLKPLFEECFEESGDQNGIQNGINWTMVGTILLMVLGVIMVIFLVSMCYNHFRKKSNAITIQSTHTSDSTTENTESTQWQSTATTSTIKTIDSSGKPTGKSVPTKPQDSSAVSSPPKPKPSFSSKTWSPRTKPI